MQGVATISAAAANDMITDLCFDLDLEVKVQVQEAPPHLEIEHTNYIGSAH